MSQSINDVSALRDVLSDKRYIKIMCYVMLSDGEPPEDSEQTLKERHRFLSPQGDIDSRNQELDASYVEMLSAIRVLLELEVPEVSEAH